VTREELRQHCYDRLTAANLLGWYTVGGINWQRAIASLPHAQLDYSYPPEKIDGKDVAATGIECLIIDANRIDVQPLLNSQAAVETRYSILLRSWEPYVSLLPAVEAISHGLSIQNVRQPEPDGNPDAYVAVVILDVLAQVCEVG
jgi:hypothetical protein